MQITSFLGTRKLFELCSALEASSSRCKRQQQNYQCNDDEIDGFNGSIS